MSKEQLEAIGNRVAKGIIPQCYLHLSDEEYRDISMQMVADLYQLAKNDGCVAAAMALEVLKVL